MVHGLANPKGIIVLQFLLLSAPLELAYAAWRRKTLRSTAVVGCTCMYFSGTVLFT